MAGQTLAAMYTSVDEPQHGSVEELCTKLRLGRSAVGVVKTRVKGREGQDYVHLGECIRWARGFWAMAGVWLGRDDEMVLGLIWA